MAEETGQRAPRTKQDTGPPYVGALTRKPFGGKRRLYNVVRLRFKTNFISHVYDARLLDLHKDDRVIVETSKGPALAIITSEVDRAVMNRGSLKRVLRKATSQDLQRDESNTRREREAFTFALSRIRHRKLDMKLIQVHCMHDGSKIIFYFSADGRIDFRELVKDLAHRFRTRIEMRQIGARDGARMIGGIGPCGRELCCSSFLENFAPVSIRMAKDQGLTLNPKKVSGMCGRLMCCLVYEQQIYHRSRKRLPRAGRQVETAEGPGKIHSLDVVQEKVAVFLDDGRLEHFPVREVVVLTPREVERRKADAKRVEAARAEAAQKGDPLADSLREVVQGEDEYLWEEPGKKGDGEERPNRRRRRRRRSSDKPASSQKEGKADASAGANAEGGDKDAAGRPTEGRSRRRRRGGRGRRGGAGGGGGEGQSAARGGESKDGGKGGNAGNRSGGEGRGRGGRSDGEKKPRGPRAEGEGGDQKSGRNRRRRRRRGGEGKGGGGGRAEGGAGDGTRAAGKGPEGKRSEGKPANKPASKPPKEG